MEERREIIYSDISSASRKQPYDAMVYLEGTKVIAVDSDGNVIAKGTAGTDDATVIQAAVDLQGSVYIDTGTYVIPSTRYISLSSNTHVAGGNNTKLALSEGADTGLRVFGEKTNVVTSVSASVASGATEIQVSSATGFLVGDHVLITSDRVSHYLSAPYGEIQLISAIADNTITLESGTHYYYNLSDSPTITNVDMVSNVTIRNLEIYHPDDTASAYGIWCKYARNVEISNVKLHHLGACGISFNSCICSRAVGCEIYASNLTTHGYGVTIENACSDITVSESTIYDVHHHCIAIGGGMVDGYPTHIAITNNYCRTSTGNVLDSHYGDIVTYQNNIICGGMEVGAEHVLIDGCVFENCPSYAITPRTERGMLDTLVISNCKFINCGGMAIRFYSIVNLSSISISGCSFDGCAEAVRIRSIGDTAVIPSDTAIDTIHICGCIIRNCTDDGIAISKTGDCPPKTTVIANNLIENCDGYGITVSATAASEQTMVSVTGNVLRATGQDPAEAETAAIGCIATKCHIADNIISDIYKHGISFGGTTAVISNNLIGGIIYNSSNYNTSGIRVTAAKKGTISGNVIEELTDLYRCIHCDPASVSGLHVYGNTLMPTVANNYVLTGNTVYKNTHFITENAGAAATVADGGTIAHGCSATPTKLSVVGTVAGEMVAATSVDGTNITVAIKKPDGSAGTTQTVYWRAEV